jgi:hypothetical protein
MSSTARIVPAQRLHALQRANRVRGARAQLKGRIAAGELAVGEVILSSRWEIEKMPIGELLISQRHWGERRCRAFLAALGLRETKTIGSMTERQRIAAAAVLTRGQAVPETTT